MDLFKCHKWLLSSFVFSLIYWFIEAVRDVLIYGKGPLYKQLFMPEPISFWMKLLVICMIILGGAAIDSIYNENSKPYNHKNRNVIPLGIGLSTIYWLLASLRDTLINNDLNIETSIFHPSALYLWMRLLGIFMIMLLALCAQSSINALEAERKKSEEDKKHVFQIIDQMVFPVQLISPDGIILQINNAFKQTFPSIASVCSNKIVHISDIPFYREQNIVESVIKAKNNRTIFIPQIVYENGVSDTGPQKRIYEATISPITSNQSCWLIIIIWTDITDKIETENQKEEIRSQLLKAQKMEAIGNLAGGIAHDFNNLITAIQGTADLAIMDINESKADTKSLQADLKDIISASKRAAELTNQLLLFSRRRIMGFKPIQVNDTISGLIKIIKRLLTENISVHSELAPNLWTIDGDRSTLEQVIMNLAVNAKDAMPHGGKLFISTENIIITQDTAVIIPESRPGKFVCITVSDTGTGIPDDIRENIFEPFFTTKDAKNGTGLGLSVAYGIVQQHKGWINVYSEVGSGTTFKIFLPAGNKEVSYKQDDTVQVKNVNGHGEKILVVEDDESVRMTTVRALRRSGYQVVSAIHAEDAEEILSQQNGDFSLLLTDVVLPGKSGIELAHLVSAKFPDINIILGSGYTDAARLKAEILDKGYLFIQKPYEIFNLLTNVRQQIGNMQH